MKTTLTTLLLLFTLLALSGCENSALSDAEHVSRAEGYLAKEQMRAAAIELKNALRLNPDNAKARWLLGKLNLEVGNGAYAEKELLLAAKLGVASDAIAPLLAKAYLYQFKLEKLEQIDIRSLEAGAAADILATMSFAALATKDLTKAQEKLAAIDKLGRATPYTKAAKAALLNAQGKGEKAKALLQQILADDPTYAAAWSLLGEIELRQKHLQDAENAFTAAIDHRLNNTFDYLQRATARIQLKDHQGAQHDLDILLQRSPGEAKVHLLRGINAFSQKQINDARDAFEKALSLDKLNLQAPYYLGVTYFIQAETEKAREHLEQFFRTSPGNLSGRLALAFIYVETGELYKADKLLRPVIQQAPENTLAAKLFAMLMIKQGATDAALKQLHHIEQLEPVSPDPQYWLGRGYLVKKDETLALEHLRRSLELDPLFQQSDILMIIHHINAGHYAEALASADEFIEKFPAAALPHTLKAAALLASGDETGALEQYQAALRINPGDPSANHAMAALAIKRGEADTARQLFRNVLRAHPNNLPTLLKFARLEGSQGNTRGMLDWLKNAAKTHPDALRPRVLSARYYLKHKDHFKVIELLTPPQLDYVFDHSRLLLLGTAYLGASSYEQAAQTFETLIKHFPQSAEGHYLLSAAYSARGDKEAARREVERTIELNPNNLLAKLTYIKMLLTSNDLQAAEQQLDALLVEHAQTPEVQFLLGVLAEAQGEMAQAEKRYAKAAQDYPNSRTVRAYARILAKQDRNAEARTVLTNWLEQHPQDRPIRLILADRLLRDEPSQAREQYETLLVQDSHNVLALNNLASTLIDSEPARSLEYARQAYELQPDAPAVMDTLAMAALANDDLDTASSMIASAIKRTPDNPSLIYHKALVLNASGRPRQALKLLSELLTLKKDFPERDAAKELLGKLKKTEQNAG